ncbi:SAF domain-containing protein [Phytomonospora sp. NPDC050363]|uniref:SAF domain-containing protein n=1 Tax=Phytomonospora sp. NPDC050363 TaxID=3155642 RepID=UPI0033EB72A4
MTKLPTAPTIPSGPAQLNAPHNPPRVVAQRRPRGKALALGVTVIILGALVGGWVLIGFLNLTDVVAVAADVPAGTQLTQDHLTVVQVNPAPGLDIVEASTMDTIIGQYAAVTLVSGSLLVPAQITADQLVGVGQSQISIGLKAERVPSADLKPGDKITVVATPEDLPGTGEDPGNGQAPTLAPPLKWNAVVTGTSHPEKSTLTIVFLAVAETDAPTIVALAAEGSISLVLAGA